MLRHIEFAKLNQSPANSARFIQALIESGTHQQQPSLTTQLPSALAQLPIVAAQSLTEVVPHDTTMEAFGLTLVQFSYILLAAIIFMFLTIFSSYLVQLIIYIKNHPAHCARVCSITIVVSLITFILIVFFIRPSIVSWYHSAFSMCESVASFIKYLFTPVKKPVFTPIQVDPATPLFIPPGSQFFSGCTSGAMAVIMIIGLYMLQCSKSDSQPINSH